MSIPDIIGCLQRVGYPVPLRSVGVLIDSEAEPTWAKFTISPVTQDHEASTRLYVVRHDLLHPPERQALMLQAITLQRAGWRLAGSPKTL